MGKLTKDRNLDEEAQMVRELADDLHELFETKQITRLMACAAMGLVVAETYAETYGDNRALIERALAMVRHWAEIE